MEVAENASNLLDETDSDDTETEILLNCPLSSTIGFKNSDVPLVNLQRFVASAVTQCGEELDVYINQRL